MNNKKINKFIKLCVERNYKLTSIIISNNIMKSGKKIDNTRTWEIELDLAEEYERQGRYFDGYTRLLCSHLFKSNSIKDSDILIFCKCCSSVRRFTRLKLYLKSLEQKGLTFKVPQSMVISDFTSDEDFFILYLFALHLKDLDLLFKVWTHFPLFYECMLEIILNVPHPAECSNWITTHHAFFSNNYFSLTFLHLIYIERSICLKRYITVDTTETDLSDSPDFSLIRSTYNWLSDEKTPFTIDFSTSDVSDTTYLSFYALYLYKEKKLEDLNLLSDISVLVKGIFYTAKEEYFIASKQFINYLSDIENGRRIASYVYTWQAKVSEFSKDYPNAISLLYKVDVSQSNPMLSAIMSYYSMGYYKETLYYSLYLLSHYSEANQRVLFKYIGRIYLKFTDFTNAESNLLKSVEMGECDSFLYLAEVYKKQNLTEKVIKCYVGYVGIKDLPKKNRERVLKYLIQHFDEVGDEESATVYKNQLIA